MLFATARPFSVRRWTVPRGDEVSLRIVPHLTSPLWGGRKMQSIFGWGSRAGTPTRNIFATLRYFDLPTRGGLKVRSIESHRRASRASRRREAATAFRRRGGDRR